LIVWNEKNINELKYFQENDFNNLNNFSEKSDYLRFCIVLEYGGIYIDTDFECLKPIKKIINELSFFIGYDGYFGDKRGCYLNSAIFGATRENPLIREIYSSLHQRIITGAKLDSIHKIGPGYITKIIENYK
jgi:inositol phosphorylceramide mannosyltransferase catalytic subunit